MDKFIRNLEHETVLSVAEIVNAQEGQIVSKTLAQNEAVSVTVFSFAAGTEIGTHDSAGDAFVHVIEGKGRYIVDGQSYQVAAGEALVMPAKKPHSVHADEVFKMILTVVFKNK